MNLTRWSARLPGTQRRGNSASRRTATAGGDPGTNTGTDTAPPVAPAARGEDLGPPPPAGNEAADVRDVLARLPALIAVTHGPDHRLAYVNDAYAETFGHRTPGTPARKALPELEELGLLPLMDQVYRSGKPRTVTARKVARPTSGDGTASRHGYFSFTCTPVHTEAATDTGGPAAGPPRQREPRNPVPPDDHPTVPDQAGPPDRAAPPAPVRTRRSPSRASAEDRHGVLVFGADVTDQVRAAERLRLSERRQREAAVTLQHSLLPQELEQPDDLVVAATYQPGGIDAAVGGDWYDVITLGGGRTALVIGDVMGRGVRAAAVMGQLRTAVRAYARLDLPPHEIIQLLDGLAAEIDPTQIATCVYAVHDPNDHRLVYATAGHLPIVVKDADGTVHRADEPTGPPLGTGGWIHTCGSVPFGPGATAVLYTDGLVERRGQDIEEGLDSLVHALSGATGAPKIVCDRLLRALDITADHDDDVAVLVLQHPEHQGPDAELFRNVSLDLLGGVEAAPRARAFASGVLASWRFTDELRDLGVLAAGELVANSLQHGAPPMKLRLRRTDHRLIIEVSDADDHLPRPRRPDLVDESGRGISIVATIASAWGSRRTPGGGKSVWCEFALRPR